MKIVAHTVQRGLKVMPNIKNIVAVASGKGGVGKSTVAANLALALSAEGAKVGVLDADIYGPSQPTMLGISGRPATIDNRTLEPMENHGLQMSSIGLLIDADQPMVWRGPMVTQALQQLLTQTNWRDLDYLVVDMPPGTGDIQLTLAQQVPVTGVVIVTTPQDIALMDAKKGFEDVREGRRADPRHRREHGGARVQQAAAMPNTCSVPKAGRRWRLNMASIFSAACLSTFAFANRPIRAGPPSSPSPTARSRRATRKSRARSRCALPRRRRTCR